MAHESVETAKAAVVAQGTTRAFDGRTVLDGLSLTIREGEFVAMLGRSGSGKSTFLRILGALDSEITGSVRVPAKRAVVFQEPRLIPWLSVLKNVVIGLPKTTATKAMALAALSEVGLDTHADAWPRTLSGGEAQRVALARAMVREPQLLLLDEPFGALDALTRIRMHALLKTLLLRHRPAVLLVTHDVDEAILLADRVLVLKDGRISFDVEVADIPRERGSPPFMDLRRQLLAELGVTEH